MAEKIDIVEILKDKPVGLKFYSNTFGYISFNGVHKDKVYFFSEDTNAHSVKPNGKMYDGGECIIFPSKEMRDWRKFAWKKGDVLVCTDGKAEVIFERFDDDNYTSFVGKHYLESYGKDGDLLDYEQEHIGNTANYTKESDETAQTYINTIEKRLGGKLNRETLEVEKAQHEFKDGDILSCDENTYTKHVILIFHKNGNTRESIVSLIRHKNLVETNEPINDFLLSRLDYAREDEKQQLFDALAKEGKAWDAEKKLIVDLKPKCEFKPFDKVLCRNSKDDTWEADFFARLTRKEIDYTQSGKYLCVGDLWMYCIPYNEETAHLLGTTDEWKGGEG